MPANFISASVFYAVAIIVNESIKIMTMIAGVWSDRIMMQKSEFSGLKVIELDIDILTTVFRELENNKVLIS